MKDCLFCKIVAGEIPSAKVYEDGELLAFMDIQPVNPGHVLVIPKEHHATLAETPDELAGSLMKVVPSLSRAVMQATGAPACNLSVNNGKEAGQLVFHTHLHIMPRFENDGYAIMKGKPDAYQGEEMNEMADKIRGNIKVVSV